MKTMDDAFAICQRENDASDSPQDSPTRGADAAELPQASRNASADSPRGVNYAGMGRRASQTAAGDTLDLQKDSHNPFEDARPQPSAVYDPPPATRQKATLGEPPQPEIEPLHVSVL